MIRKFEIEDLDEVMNIWLETNIKTHTFVDKSYWENNFDDVKNKILDAEVYVCEEEREVIGFVGLVEGYIAGIFVKENMQNNGIGKQFISKCKEKYEEITLNVYEKNEKAISFYKREGFCIVNREIDKEVNEMELFMRWKKIDEAIC